MKKITKIILSIVLSLFLIGCIAAGIVFAKVYKEFTPVAKAENELVVKFKIPYGTSAYEVTQQLKSENLIRNSRIFYTLLCRPHYLKKLYSKIDFPEKIEFKSGIYHISNTLNYGQIIELLSSGKQELIKLSIPEGLTITKIAKLLEENDVCSKDDFIEICHDSKTLNSLGIECKSAEGYLFPDTYYFDYGMKVDTILKLFIDNFNKHVAQIENLKELSFEDMRKYIILASIVEREYKLPEEAPLIASVFTNRLNHSIGLQSCATIEYIITEIQGKPHPERILNDDLKIDSNYNTYKWRGLPPGPISNPGMNALKAAANPPVTDYYFFQVIDADAGRHVFTSSFNEHKQTHILLSK